MFGYTVRRIRGLAPRIGCALVLLVVAGLAACGGGGGGGSISSNSTSVIPPVSGGSSALAFVLTSSGDQQNISTYLGNSSLDGIALQESWGTWETSSGTYGWDQSGNNLDKVLAAAQQAGKRVTLHMFALPDFVPSWLADDNPAPQYYYDSVSGAGPYIEPWDSTYLGEYTTFLQALASHLNSSGYASTVFDVSLVVPVAEMNIMPCDGSTLGTTTALGSTTISYDSISYQAAWEEVGGVLASQFPNIHFFVSPPENGLVCAPTKDYTFYQDLMTDLLGLSGNFWMFAADLDTTGSQRATRYLSTVGAQTKIGYQTICSSTNSSSCSSPMSGTYPNNLQQAICAGLTSGGQYFEIYKADVLNTNTLYSSTIQTAIQTVHNPSLCP